MNQRTNITSKTTLLELAAIVSEALEDGGILATLSGGAAVSLYTDNRYESEDLDFVTTALINELAVALEPLGFIRSGRPRMSVFTHPATRWYLEFPPAPLGFGSTYVNAEQCAVLSTAAGKIRIITPTHSVMDRLIAAAVWRESQSLEQAVMVAEAQADQLEWDELRRWVEVEEIADDRYVRDFFARVKSP